MCGSIFHFAGKCRQGCPDSYHNIQGAYQVDTDEANQCDEVFNSEVFVLRSIDECLLDSCCISNVMGKEWKNTFFANMSDKDLSEVETYNSTAKFKFGGEKPVHATEKVKFPCYVLGERSFITADVVDRDIPLLTSKAEMKKRHFSINFNNDTLEVKGKSYALDTTPCGHFKLSLWNDDEVNICVNEMNDDEKLKMIIKLHRQFRHQSAKATENLLRKAEILTPQLQEINQRVAENCDVCKRYKRNPARPVVSLPMASTFNESVAMDLKVFSQGKMYFIYFIDLFT